VVSGIESFFRILEVSGISRLGIGSGRFPLSFLVWILAGEDWMKGGTGTPHLLLLWLSSYSHCYPHLNISRIVDILDIRFRLRLKKVSLVCFVLRHLTSMDGRKVRPQTREGLGKEGMQFVKWTQEKDEWSWEDLSPRQVNIGIKSEFNFRTRTFQHLNWIEWLFEFHWVMWLILDCGLVSNKLFFPSSFLVLEIKEMFTPFNRVLW
jgi:hypothetical protein